MQEKGRINKVVLGLGSNLGDKLENLEQALSALGQSVGNITLRSGFYASKAHGFVSENDFVNLVAELETVLSAREVLSKTEAIELESGRKNKSANKEYQDRLIDIDILFFNDEIIDEKYLHVPHKNLYHRKFVLVPLVEILPELVDPKTGNTSADLLKMTTDQSRIFLL
ncbi:MAG: 2-amino-4-hydroxy-6-hydroxymethyldihydropteridine diphosphokinase [Bacteroidota bacterium]